MESAVTCTESAIEKSAAMDVDAGSENVSLVLKALPVKRKIDGQTKESNKKRKKRSSVKKSKKKLSAEEKAAKLLDRTSGHIMGQFQDLVMRRSEGRVKKKLEDNLYQVLAKKKELEGKCAEINQN